MGGLYRQKTQTRIFHFISEIAHMYVLIFACLKKFSIAISEQKPYLQKERRMLQARLRLLGAVSCIM